MLKMKCIIFRIKPLTETERREALIICMLKKKAFAGLATQDKITCVAKAISGFQRDYGYMPVKMVEVLSSLHADLNSKLVKSFQDLTAGQETSLRPIPFRIMITRNLKALFPCHLINPAGIVKMALAIVVIGFFLGSVVGVENESLLTKKTSLYENR